MSSTGQEKEERPNVSPAEQKRIIKRLDPETSTEIKGARLYLISLEWYSEWEAYVGYDLPDGEATFNQQNLPKPGCIRGYRKITESFRVSEDMWKHFVQWYGVEESNTMARQFYDMSVRCLFRISLMSIYGSTMGNIFTTIWLPEEIGYIERQLRHRFQVPPSKKSRVWLVPKPLKQGKCTSENKLLNQSDSRLLINRKAYILFDRTDIPTIVANTPDKVHLRCLNSVCDYQLVLEVSTPGGDWPSGRPGEPTGSLQVYDELFVSSLHSYKDDWERDLDLCAKSANVSLAQEMDQAKASMLSTTQAIVDKMASDISGLRRSLEEKLTSVTETERELEETKKKMADEQETLSHEKREVQEEQKALIKEKAKLEYDIKQMEKINKIQNNIVKLDVGGQKFTTSVQTLTSDPNCMLAAMFSGRHALKRQRNGTYFLDRDGTHFRFILNYLRDGDSFFQLPDDPMTQRELLSEANYLQLQGLTTLIRNTTGNGPSMVTENGK